MITAGAIRRIRDIEPGELPVISMYLTVPVDPRERNAIKTQVNSLLERLRPLGEDESLSRAARQSVRQDLERVEKTLAAEHWKPPAIALFTCAGKGFLEEVQLPRRVGDRIVADTTPLIWPMMAVLRAHHRAVVAVIDSKSAQVWELFQGEIQRLQAAEDRALRKPNYAGWHGLNEYTVGNKADELEKHHLLRVVGMLDQLFTDPSYGLLVLGGQREELARLQTYLPQRLRQRLAGTFAVDPRPKPDAEVCERASAVVHSWQRQGQLQQARELFERAASHRPAAIGLRDCLWAASTGAVEELFVHDNATAPGVLCPSDGWLGESGDSCPSCGTATRQTADIIDELVVRVIDDGGSIEQVDVDTELTSKLVGALLRFPLPPLP